VHSTEPAHARKYLTSVAVCFALLLLGGATTAATVAVPDRHEPRSPVPVFVVDHGRFSVFDPPGLNANELIDVNDRGQVAGTYIDPSGPSRGFVRDKHGRFTLVDVPGATETYVSKINDRGQIAGVTCYAEACDSQRGFLRSPDGTFRTIHVPGAATTEALGLDDQGRIVGQYVDRDGDTHGYLWQRGHFTTIDIKDAAGTSITGLNDRGEMVGLYVDADGAFHAFFRTEGGRVTTYGASGVPFTVPFDVNDRGTIVGITTDALTLPDADQLHGFVLDIHRGDRLTPIDVPGAPRTVAFGIDDHGRITGIYDNTAASAARMMSLAPMPFGFDAP
jgi:uncharacterized membrane protein